MSTDTAHHPTGSRVHRALALAGAFGPLLFVAVFTLAGLLRPGYSATADAVSDLGVGARAWIQNANFLAFGGLLLTFAIGFRQRMIDTLGRRAASTGAMLIALTGAGLIGSAAFTATPATEGLHLLLGFVLTFGSAIATTIYVGRQLRDVAGWQRFGRYSRLTALGAGVLVALSFVALNPASPLEPLHLGGLIERGLAIEVFAWHTVAGWRLWQTPSGEHDTDREDAR